MNKVILIGRIANDIDLRKTESNKSVVGIRLAVNRKYNKNETDFISVVVWNQAAEYLNQYANKGDSISVCGAIQTRNYEGKNGKVYITEVIADEVKIECKVKKETTENKEEQHHQYSLEPDNKEDKEFEDSFRLKDYNSENLPFY